ncbi:MAG: 1-deoxy-D-xylulose-5-phosphate reductoisomerase, partial [Oscillospiraceae bacterium]|nr:1-deoxy-D-xylulose-5-phosphate reductoisomerase [Oscillospiraceae bacterium]
MKKISILGSTGSIGTQAIEVCRRLKYKVNGISAGKNIKKIEEQAREFNPKIISLQDEKAYKEAKTVLADMDCKILCGEDGNCEVASIEENDIVLNSIVGISGLVPTAAAIKARKTVALANKETVVASGGMIIEMAKEYGVKILPVDSEHSAVFQCMQGIPDGSLSKIILTASGGPFFGKKTEELQEVTAEKALRHPNWSMGGKITIDCATLMNKALEIIEAAYLFGVDEKNIDVVVHRESVIHSLIELKDGSVLAQLGVPDMKIPIQYALTYPKREKNDVKHLSLTDYGRLTFYTPDYETFECLKAGREALRRGGLYPCIVNGANEKAVEMFFNGKIKFTDIGKIVSGSLDLKATGDLNIETILKTDKIAKEYAENF